MKIALIWFCSMPTRINRLRFGFFSRYLRSFVFPIFNCLTLFYPVSRLVLIIKSHWWCDWRTYRHLYKMQKLLVAKWRRWRKVLTGERLQTTMRKYFFILFYILLNWLYLTFPLFCVCLFFFFFSTTVSSSFNKMACSSAAAATVWHRFSVICVINCG